MAAAKYILSGDSKEVKSYKEKVNKENELLREVLTEKQADDIVEYMRQIDDKVIDEVMDLFKKLN